MFQKAFLFGVLFLVGLVASSDPLTCTMNTTSCATGCNWSDTTIWLNCALNGTATYPASGDIALINATEKISVYAFGITVDTIVVDSTATVAFSFTGINHITSWFNGTTFTVEVVNGTFTYNGDFNSDSTLTVDDGAEAIVSTISYLDHLVIYGKLTCSQFHSDHLTISGNATSIPADAVIEVYEKLTITGSTVSVGFFSTNATVEIDTSYVMITGAMNQIGGAVTITASTITGAAFNIRDGLVAASMSVTGSVFAVSNFNANGTLAGQDGVSFDKSTMNVTTVVVNGMLFTTSDSMISSNSMTFESVAKVTFSCPTVTPMNVATLNAVNVNNVYFTNCMGTVSTLNAANSMVSADDFSNLTFGTFSLNTASSSTMDNTTNVAFSTVNVGDSTSMTLNGQFSVSGKMSLMNSAKVNIATMNGTYIKEASMSNASEIVYTNMVPFYHLVDKFSYTGAQAGLVSLMNSWLKVSSGEISGLALVASTFGVGTAGQTAQNVAVRTVSDAGATASTINVHFPFTIYGTGNPLMSIINIFTNSLTVAGPVELAAQGMIVEMNGTFIIAQGGQFMPKEAIALNTVQFNGGNWKGPLTVATLAIGSNTLIEGDVTITNSLTLNGAVLNVTGSYKQNYNTTLAVTFPSKVKGALLIVGNAISFGENSLVSSTVDAYPQNTKTVNMLLATAGDGVTLSNSTLVKNMKDSAAVTLSVSPIAGNNTNADNLYIVYKRSGKDVAKQGMKNNWKWIVIGVVAGLVVIAILVVVVRRYKRRHHYQEV